MIQIRNGLRFNIYASATIDGVRYPNFTDRSLWPVVGITEVSEPEPPEDYTPEGWVREEMDVAPYVVWRPFTEEELKARVPRSVTMRQGRLALLATGKLSLVQAAIDAIVDADERAAAQIEWEYAATIDRDSPFVQQMAAGLGLTDEQMDQLFTLASTI
jgi:hypothetical protein